MSDYEKFCDALESVEISKSDPDYWLGYDDELEGEGSNDAR